VTRPQQVTRSEVVADQVPVPRDLSQGFFWSASLTASSRSVGSGYGTVLESQEEAYIAHEAPTHATNGPEDFDTEMYPSVAIIIPRDGIYAISYFARIGDYGDISTVGNVDLYLLADDDPVLETSQVFNGIDYEYAEIQRTRVGIPMYAGARMRLFGINASTQRVHIGVVSLEATYLGPIGNVYPVKGGGPL
jgi:hypothetical protein